MDYLQPYHDALKRYGNRFESLLWGSRKRQLARFEALIRLYDFTGKTVLDAGCGKGDLLEFLLDRGMPPAGYMGIEGLADHARDARDKHLPHCQIVEADFVADPSQLRIGADVIVFCGALNTMDVLTFYNVIRQAVEAARHAVLFNFLARKELASATWLTWHRPEDVLAFCQTLTPDVRLLDDYLDGDCTVGMMKTL